MKNITETESVRLEKNMLDRVRPYAKAKRMTLSGFISSEMDKIMDRVDNKLKNKLGLHN